MDRWIVGLGPHGREWVGWWMVGIDGLAARSGYPSHQLFLWNRITLLQLCISSFARLTRVDCWALGYRNQCCVGYGGFESSSDSTPPFFPPSTHVSIQHSLD